MNNSIIGLVGASGFGSVVLPLLEAQNVNSEIVFIDEDKSKTNLLGRRVVTEEEFLNLEREEKYFNISISNPEIRKDVELRLSKYNVRPISIFSEDLKTLISVEFSKGAIVCPHSLFTSNIKIGKFFQ